MIGTGLWPHWGRQWWVFVKIVGASRIWFASDEEGCVALYLASLSNGMFGREARLVNNRISCVDPSSAPLFLCPILDSSGIHKRPGTWLALLRYLW